MLTIISPHTQYKIFKVRRLKAAELKQKGLGGFLSAES